MCLSVQILAAFYRILDLWYTIQTEYPQVIREIVTWVGVSALIAGLVGERLRSAFFWGIAAYLPLYLLIFVVLRHALRSRIREKERRKGNVSARSK